MDRPVRITPSEHLPEKSAVSQGMTAMSSLAFLLQKHLLGRTDSALLLNERAGQVFLMRAVMVNVVPK